MTGRIPRDGPYSRLELTGRLPEGVRIEVSQVAPAFGHPGGGLQVRFLDGEGEAISITRLSSSDMGVLAHVDDAAATSSGHVIDGVGF